MKKKVDTRYEHGKHVSSWLEPSQSQSSMGSLSLYSLTGFCIWTRRPWSFSVFQNEFEHSKRIKPNEFIRQFGVRDLVHNFVFFSECYCQWDYLARLHNSC